VWETIYQESRMALPPRLYPTDLSDAEWRILEPLIPAAKPGGRPSSRVARSAGVSGRVVM
jgi:transposase